MVGACAGIKKRSRRGGRGSRRGACCALGGGGRAFVCLEGCRRSIGLGWFLKLLAIRMPVYLEEESWIGRLLSSGQGPGTGAVAIVSGSRQRGARTGSGGLPCPADASRPGDVNRGWS